MKLLITGATGLIGSKLVTECLNEKFTVHYLTTSKEKIEHTKFYKGFYWNPQTQEIDKNAFEEVSVIIHLAGASLARRWTRANKKIILDSRTHSSNLIFKTLKNISHNVTQFVSSSGIGIYPSSKTKLYTEESTAVDPGFLGEVVVAWEAAADQFKTLGIDVTKVRTGMVLAKEEGALPKFIEPIRAGIGAPLGSGEQWQSWIHIDDIAGIYLEIIKNEWEGIYNGVAPTPVTNKRLVTQIAQQLKKPIWLPNIPGFFLKGILGEMSVLALKGQLVSSKKLEEIGYDFKFKNIEKALEDLI